MHLKWWNEDIQCVCENWKLTIMQTNHFKKMPKWLTHLVNDPCQYNSELHQNDKRCRVMQTEVDEWEVIAQRIKECWNTVQCHDCKKKKKSKVNQKVNRMEREPSGHWLVVKLRCKATWLKQYLFHLLIEFQAEDHVRSITLIATVYETNKQCNMKNGGSMWKGFR